MTSKISETEGHRRFRAWLGTQPSMTAVAARLACTRQAIKKWLAFGARPKTDLQVAIEVLTGIPCSAWLRPEERRAMSAARRRSGTHAT